MKVNEIFYSLQGEGYFTGTPAVFLRLSGCNLKCSFCDTDHHDGEELSFAEILARLSAYPSRHLVVTGGEPSLQLDETTVDSLHEAGYFIQVETNGTNPLPEGIDWVTCSPKPDSRLALTHCDELKVVYTGQDVEAIAAGIEATHRYLQPCSGLNTAEVVDYLLAHPHWRLSLQTHKIIDIR